MSAQQPTTELALRVMIARLRDRSSSDAVSAAAGAVSDLASSVDDSVAAHSAQIQHVHGAGDFYVAKSSHPSQFPELGRYPQQAGLPGRPGGGGRGG